MIKFKHSRILMLTLLLIAMSVSVDAEVPQIINYQGRLTNTGGDPVPDGSYLMNFKLYGSEIDHDSLWWSGFQPVTVTNGLFTYQLGLGNPIPSDFFGPGSDLFLGVTIDNNPEMVPRTRITSSAFAFQAIYSDTANVAIIAQDIACNHCISTDDIDDGCITTDKILPSAITSDKIQNGAVTSAKIFDGTINSDDIASGGVSLSNLAQSGATDAQAITWNGSESQWQPSVVGDITSVGVIETGALTGGGTSGHVELGIEYNGVSTGFIQNNTIQDEDIWSLAAIDPTKIRGTAVNLSDAQTISGAKTFKDLNIESTTRRLAVPSAAFVPSSNTYSYARSVGYLRNTTTGSQIYFAPVFLPNGATVTDVKATFYDNDGSYNGSIQLIKIYMASGGEILMAYEATTSTPGFSTIVESSIFSETVSNDGYNYYLIASLQYGSSSLNMRFYGAEIVYTITKPLP
ncbi:MAG: hypothetical protein E4G91_06130 [Candidatus Zixiibacteriota bacterium]|nr:MAG: hypothetical protein E4G91_06130 [candidate division Zixibacteria bacterium]